MFPLAQLQAERSHKALSAKDLVSKAEQDNRPMSAEEIAIFDRLTSEIENIDARIKANQDHAERAERLNQIVDRINAPAGRTTSPDQPGSTSPVVTASSAGSRPFATPVRSRPLVAFKGHNAQEKAYRVGMWARAILFGDQRAGNWCLSNGVGTDIRNALSTSTAGGGAGFLVPEEFSEAIIDLRESYGVFRQNAFVQPMGRDTMVVPRRLTGVSIGPVGENPTSAITETQPTWNNVRLTAKKAGGLVKLSTEISEDAVIDLGDYLVKEFAYAFALFEDQCGFIGTGLSTYLGINGLMNILTAASSLTGAVDAASGHDTFAEIDATDLATVMSKLPEYALMNAKWYCSNVALQLVFGRLMAAAGGNTISDLQGGYQRQYLGYPIVVSQVLPTSTGDLSDLPMLLFGDLSASSTLGDRRDIRIFPSEHRYMDTDQIGVRGTVRFDIVNHDVGTTSAAGPIVALVGE